MQAVCEAVQNPVQHPAASTRTEPQGVPANQADSAENGSMQDDASVCDPLEKQGVGVTGLEPVTSSV